MTIKTVLAALALTIAPTFALAMGCSDRSHQAQSCATGMVWDSASQSCVKQITG